MKCQQCQNPAIVHLTDLVTEVTGKKYPVEIHLCLSHAIAAGYLPALPLPPEGAGKAAGSGEAKGGKSFHPELAAPGPTSIVPVPVGPTGLAVSRKDRVSAAPDTLVCPACGNTWANFKQFGLIGCANDYDLFAGKLLPLIQRTQENASQHIGKVPQEVAGTDHARQIAITRLRRELQGALDCEDYEQAARVRDKLKTLTSLVS